MFAYCKELEEVRLPNSITSVKENAFRGCSTLQSITLPEGVKYIDSAAFYQCFFVAVHYASERARKN